jgi:hypothetical protein
MPVESIVCRLLSRVAMHRARLTAVAAGVVAILLSRRLSSAALGRALPGSSAKHAIKRFDRLTGNGHLFAEIPLIYAAIAEEVVKVVRPVILIDWTHLRGRNHALAAGLATDDGRPIVLLAKVHDVKQLGSAKVQRAFLADLARILPPFCLPILVSDAGFHGDFFRDVVSLGWDFVGRIRGTAQLRVDGSLTGKLALYKRASARALDFSNAGLYAKRTLPCRLVLVRRPRAKRRSKPTANKELLEYRKAARDPWLLATSLGKCDASAEEIIQLYGLRMQIEEAFRDTKSARFGIGLGEARSRTAKRMAVQLVLAALALVAAFIVGQAAEARGEHRQLQANTLKRRVLSLVRVGLEWVRAHAAEIRADIEALKRLLAQPPDLAIRGDP